MGRGMHGSGRSPDALNPRRSMLGLKQLPLWGPYEVCVPCAWSSISSPKGLDSEKLYEEKNHSGQGHSRDTAANFSNWLKFCQAGELRSSLPGRKLEDRHRGRVQAQLWALLLPAKQWQRKPSSLLWRTSFDCLRNRERRTHGRYFRPLPLRNYLECSIGLFWRKC